MHGSYFGYTGKVLYIDLGSGSIEEEDLEEELLRTFIGGYGVNNKLIFDLVAPNVEPLSPRNSIVIGAGAFTGLPVPGASKVFVTTKFPINGAFATSAAGGNFSWMLKSNGYDHVVISGRAEHPVYLLIANGSAEIHDARYLWGKDAFTTIDALSKIHRPCSVIPIGPSGEKLVKISITSIDKLGTIGSGGMPAVMGSKNLKAIVVQPGAYCLKVARPSEFFKLANRLYRRMQDWNNRNGILKYGLAPTAIQGINELCIFKNWREVRDDDFEIKDRTKALEAYAGLRKPIACPTCPFADREILKVKSTTYGKPIVAYVAHLYAPRFTAPSAMAQIEQMIRYLDAANRLGLCINELRGVITLVAYLRQEGAISKKRTVNVGLDEDFESSLALLELIAHRKGIGDILAEGVLAVAMNFGKDLQHYPVHIKGRTPVYDPRLRTLGTEAFEQITNPRGAHAAAGGSPSFTPGRAADDFRRHCARMGVPPVAIDRIVGTTWLNPGRLSKYTEDWYSLFSCLGICNRAWVNRFYDLETIAQLYVAITGLETSPAQIMQSAERAWNLNKILNIRAGFGRREDRAPAAWFQALQGQNRRYVITDYFRGKVLTERDVENFLRDYYEERGWNRQTSVPSRKKLIKLGLEGYLSKGEGEMPSQKASEEELYNAREEAMASDQ